MVNFVVAGGAIITIATIWLYLARLGSRYRDRQKREAERAQEERRNAEVEIIRHR